MIDVEYANAYSEVLEILKYVSEKDYKKIPQNKIKIFEEYKNKEYIFNYNPNKALNEQDVSKIAKGIIAILFRDYWATTTQRQMIISKQNCDRMKLEKQKREKYNPDNIFNKNVKPIKNIETEENQNIDLIEIKEKSLFQRIIDKIKVWFVKN